MSYSRFIQITLMMLLALGVVAGVFGLFYYNNTHPSAPEPPQREWLTTCDREMLRETFLSCLERLPKGPDQLTAASNDWAEVIKECKDAADTIACRSAYILREEKK